jgi:hypothetical protein
MTSTMFNALYTVWTLYSKRFKPSIETSNLTWSSLEVEKHVREGDYLQASLDKKSLKWFLKWLKYIEIYWNVSEFSFRSAGECPEPQSIWRWKKAPGERIFTVSSKGAIWLYCFCIDMYVLYIYVCVCAYMYIHVYRWMYIDGCTCAYMCVHVCTCIYMCVHLRTCMYIYAHLCTCMYIYVHVCIVLQLWMYMWMYM